MYVLNPSTDPNPAPLAPLAPLPLCLVSGQFQAIVALHRGVLGSGSCCMIIRKFLFRIGLIHMGIGSSHKLVVFPAQDLVRCQNQSNPD